MLVLGECFTMNNQEENEVSINLKDMFAYMLHNWKILLIISLVLMAVVGGFMSYRDYAAIQSKYKEETYISMTENLTDNQIESIEQFYNRYLNYQARMKDNQFYIDNSALMKLDTNNVSILTREYIIKTNYQGIMSSFSAAALDLDDFEKMVKVMDDNIDARYVNELVSLGGSTVQDATDIDTDKVGDVINGFFANSYTGLLTLRITYNDRETCERMAEIADEAIWEHFELLKASGIDADMTVLTTSYTEKVDESTAEYQRSTIERNSNQIQAYYNFVEDAEKILDEDEYKVFSYLIQKDQEVTDHVHWKKWIVIGFGAGLVLALAILVVNYFLIPGIKTMDDALLLTKEKEMGVVIQKAKSKVFLGKLFHNWAKKVEFHGVRQVPDNEMIPLVCDRIIRICEGKSAKSIFIISDVESGYSKDVVDKCIGLLSENGLSAKAGNPIASIEALKGVRESAAAVIALTNKESLPNSIKGNIAVCEENSVPIIGNFIIHPQR